MFRRINLMLLISSLLVVGNDALAAGRKSARRKTEREKRAEYLSAEARSARNVAAVVAKGKRDRSKQAALRRQLTVAGVTDKELFTSISGANQAVFTPQDLIELLQNPATAGALRDNAQEAIRIIDAVLAHRDWKHFAPVAQVLETIRQPLADLQASIALAITNGQLPADAPVGVYLHPVAPEVPVVEPAGVIHQEDAVDLGREDAIGQDQGYGDVFIQADDFNADDFNYAEIQAVVAPVKQETPWISNGTVVACAGTFVVFAVAGVTVPVFVPAMAMKASIGAGIGAGFAVASSLWQQKNLKETAKEVIKGASHGAFGGTVGFGIKAYVPTNFLGNAITECAFEGASLGIITGSVQGVDDNEILRRAFTCGVTGAAFGTAFGALKELYNYVTSLQEALDQSQDALVRSQEHVAQLERELVDAIHRGVVDKEAATAYINKLKVTIDQQNTINIENLRRLNEANAVNLQQSTIIAEQQAVIAEQEVAVGMLNQKIEENTATFQRMHRVIQEQDAANRVLTDRVVALEKAAARRLAHQTALVVRPTEISVCADQGMSHSSDAPVVAPTQKTLLDPLYEFTGAKAAGKCIKAGSGSTECKGLLDSFYKATGAEAAGNWVASFWR